MTYMDANLEVELSDYFHSLGERKRDLNSGSSRRSKANRLDVRDVGEVNSRGRPHGGCWDHTGECGKRKQFEEKG